VVFLFDSNPSRPRSGRLVHRLRCLAHLAGFRFPPGIMPSSVSVSPSLVQSVRIFENHRSLVPSPRVRITSVPVRLVVRLLRSEPPSKRDVFPRLVALSGLGFHRDHQFPWKVSLHAAVCPKFVSVLKRPFPKLTYSAPVIASGTGSFSSFDSLRAHASLPRRFSPGSSLWGSSSSLDFLSRPHPALRPYSLGSSSQPVPIAHFRCLTESRPPLPQATPFFFGS